MSVLTVDGAELLDETRDFIRRFCAFPDEHCLVAVTLWAAHCHLIDTFYTTPRLALLSPEAGSGKTRTLEVLAALVPNPMHSLSASSSTIFRKLAVASMSLLFDEVDTIFSKRGKEDPNEDLRALLNAGYRRGAVIPRCVGPKHEVVDFPVFCAVSLAGLGDLPDTIMSRSIIVRMRRRAPGETIEQFRMRIQEPQGHAIRDRLTLWAASVGEAAGEAWPEMPPGIVDRPAECWEPLLAVADAAGGAWPETARAACLALCKVAEDRRVSLGIRLLGDLRTIFGDEDVLHTETILARLCEPEAHGLGADAPWAEMHGKPITVRGLAGLLRRYDVRSTKVWSDGRSLQGYKRADLWDAWERYLPPLSEGPRHPEGAEGTEGTMLNGARNHPDLPHLPLPQAPERALGTDRGAAGEPGPRSVRV